LPETELMARQLVADPKEFESLRGHSHASIFDVEHVEDRQEFSVTCEAMNDLGIHADSQRQIFDVVAAVLHLGNVSIIRDQDVAKNADSMREAGGSAMVHDPQAKGALKKAAERLGVDADNLKNALVMRPAIKAGGPLNGQLSVAKAIGLKKSLAETLCVTDRKRPRAS
jgi:myosin V